MLALDALRAAATLHALAQRIEIRDQTLHEELTASAFVLVRRLQAGLRRPCSSRRPYRIKTHGSPFCLTYKLRFDMPTLVDRYSAPIRKARVRLGGYLTPTPLTRSHFLSARTNREVRLKLETQQPTGSFKVRPALNGMLAHQEQAREAGVVTSSSGNFAQAVAYAASALGVDARIVMTEGSSAFKRERTEYFGRHFGCRIVLCENTFDARWKETLRIQRESGRLLLHPYDSVETIAGNGTLGLEILEQLPETFTVLAPISGGGLIAGIALAVKAARPECRIVGVQPQANPSMKLSLEQGERVAVAPAESLADALTVAVPGESTFQAAQELVDRVVLVSEAEIAHAVRLLAMEQKLVVEPGGAVAAAALLAGAAPADESPVVCVLSGGNIHPIVLNSILNN